MIETTPRRLHVFRARSMILGPDGQVKWIEPRWASNILHDEGEQFILSAAFDTDLAGYGAPPANLYLGLDNRVTPAEGNTLTSLSGEPTTGGYARMAIPTTTGFTIADSTLGYFQADTGNKEFTAGAGGFGEVRNRFLTTALSGTAGLLIATIPFESGARTPLENDILRTTFIIGMHE